MKGIVAAFLATAASISAAAIAPRASNGPTVSLQNGTVQGVYLPTFDQEAFYGIRYAQKARRLHRAESLNSTFDQSTFDATNSTVPFCPGFGSDNWAYTASEDCLLLTVVRPAGVEAGAKLPSNVWIYGGGYQQGGIADIRYNSSWILQRAVEMEKPFVWVAIQYRTAAGGFLNSAEIEAAGQTNIGLYDQLKALNWWKENGAAFGADPDKTTLMGESAGAFSIGRHLLAFNQTTSSLFRGAILESGSPTAENFRTSAQTKTMYDRILEKAGCSNATSSLECLRGLDFDTWNSSVTPVNGSRWNPTADYGYVSPGATAQLKAGQFVQVPLLLGANRDEGTAFGTKSINTTQQLRTALVVKYPGLTNSSLDSLLAAYPDEPSLGCPYNTGDAVLPTGLQDKSNAISGDSYIVAGRRLLAEQASKSNKVYSYEFSQPPQNGTIESGTSHFQEVAYVFSSQSKSQNPLGNRPTDASLAKLMTSYWISFIHDLDPNGSQYPDAPIWPDYAASQSNMVFTRQRSYIEKDDFRKEGIALMNSVEFGQQLYH